MTTEAILNAWAAIAQAPCPRCEAEPGKPCRRPCGKIIAPHAARRSLAAELGLYVPGGPERDQP